MENGNERLSISEMYVIGKNKYSKHEEGMENWQKDLMRFVSREFHEQLNSENRREQKKANDEISLWINTTHISFFFQETWGKDSDNKKIALECLHHAQLLERKFNDQYIIQVVNQAIKACNENKFNSMYIISFTKICCICHVQFD